MSGAISSHGLMTAQRGIEKDQREVEGGYRGLRAEWATKDFMMDSKYERGKRERGPSTIGTWRNLSFVR